MSHRPPSAIRRAASELEVLRHKRAQTAARLAQLDRDIESTARRLVELVGAPLMDVVTANDDVDSLNERLTAKLPEYATAAR
jgi:hypothetical protein